MSRLFVIPARDEPVAVILRRGPARWYHVILWDTRRDHFTNGAWIKGRIYENKCDLSPDGKLFVYFVHQGSRGSTDFTHAWTAVSRPPWLHALILWPQGTTYGGGGQFSAPRTLWGVSREGTHPDFPFTGLQLADGPPEPRPAPEIVAEADWSGHDQAGNIIYCKGDALFRRKKGNETVIADFSSLKPDPKPAPDWATRPL
ncbi:MAG: hypothetical protein K8U03_26890 [Planctomycetia bacterium]|nr:hypothetical protein [Planctomycetia bacterium]